MRKISAKIIADSVNDIRGDRITSYILTYPRFIHAEVMTHRMFSRNAASSRAIPLAKMIKSVEDDPVIPIAFQNKHSGMQGTKYIEDEQGIKVATAAWLSGADSAVSCARAMDMCNITKQLCNRLLEPYLWYTCLVTATEYDNFFELRCPKYPCALTGEIYWSRKDMMDALHEMHKDGPGIEETESDLDWIMHSESGAEIHIQALAEAMWDARNDSTPKQLEPGEWHIPFKDQIDEYKLLDAVCNSTQVFRSTENKEMELGKLKVGVARAARLSYMTFDGEISYAKDIELHDMLWSRKHMSPFEHVTRSMTRKEYTLFSKQQAYIKGSGGFADQGWCNNFKGFIPYRYILEHGRKSL